MSSEREDVDRLDLARRSHRRTRRSRLRLALLVAPVAIFSLLATYVGVQQTQSADAAVFDPSDCGSLQDTSRNFLDTLVAADTSTSNDVTTMNRNGPNAAGMAAALRLDNIIIVELPQWQQQQEILDDDTVILNCDPDATPGIEESVHQSASRLSTIEARLDDADDVVVETIVSEEDGYEPCADTASVHSVVTGGKGTQATTLAGNVVKVDLSESKYPESTKHIKDAIAAGAPRVLTLDRTDPPGTADKDKKCNKRRKLSLKGIKTQKGLDRDEYPFAMTAEGGTGASVRLIGQSDNRGSGSTVGGAMRNQPDGTQFEINFVP
jgi:hypothetical protein